MLLLTLVALLGQPTAPAVPSIDGYPMRALREGAGGRVTLSCILQENLSVRDCEVIEEDPVDFGFGETAMRRVGQFRFKVPADGTLAPVGAAIRIPFNFVPSSPGEAVPVMPPPALDALDFGQLLQCHTIFTRQFKYLHREGQKLKADRSLQMLFEAGKARGMTRDQIKGRIRRALEEGVYDIDNTCDAF
jgi:TonB family protein